MTINQVNLLNLTDPTDPTDPKNPTDSKVTMKNNENSLIDLIKFSPSILDNPTIKEKISLGKPIILTAKNLTSKLPQLSILESLPILQVKMGKNDYPIVILPTVYLVNNETLKVCLHDLSASVTDELRVKSVFITENDCYAIVTDKSESIFLKTNLGIDTLAVSQDSINLGLKDFEDLDLKEYSYIFKSNPVIELSLGILEMNNAYKIIKLGENTSKEHNTPLMEVQCLKTKKVYKNVLTNHDINRNGEVNNIFQITAKNELKPTDKKSKKPRYRYVIKWQGLDFSDIKL